MTFVSLLCSDSLFLPRSSPHLSPCSTSANRLPALFCVLCLQLLFQRTSDLLYEASDKKAYFKEVSFIIPKSWPIDSFKSLSDVRKTRIHTISDADFVVKSAGMQPFVVLLLALLLASPAHPVHCFLAYKCALT